ncbi:MAG TPA: fructose-bisphosphate aldolase [Candidatus Latescibacteria bacterium]|nr:fructose-bisphosphate aldolase [Candidatus Latescibacterota bacterium]
MSAGKELRMGRLFNPESRRMVLVTLDHGICIKPMKEINDPASVVRRLVEGGADAVLLTPGIAKIVYKELVGTDTSLMLRIDGTATSIGPDLTNDELICSVEEAMRLGADAVATFGVIGVPREAQLSRKIGTTAEECDKWGMPMMTEMVPSEILSHQFEDRAKRRWPSDPEVVKFSARVAAELGADIVKGYYTGDPKTFREVIEYCPVPYVVLSGPASGDPELFLSFVREAVDCGASGVSVGRNVWTYKDPAAITRALCRIVHEDASVEEAIEELKGGKDARQ